MESWLIPVGRELWFFFTFCQSNTPSNSITILYLNDKSELNIGVTTNRICRICSALLSYPVALISHRMDVWATVGHHNSLFSILTNAQRVAVSKCISQVILKFTWIKTYLMQNLHDKSSSTTLTFTVNT